MGHDIEIETKGYSGYLRYGVFNNCSREFYFSINASQYNGCMSGTGETGTFKESDIQAGLEYYKRTKESNGEIDFLEECLKSCKETGEVKISFC